MIIIITIAIITFYNYYILQLLYFTIITIHFTIMYNILQLCIYVLQLMIYLLIIVCSSKLGVVLLN